MLSEKDWCYTVCEAQGYLQPSCLQEMNQPLYYF